MSKKILKANEQRWKQFLQARNGGDDDVRALLKKSSSSVVDGRPSNVDSDGTGGSSAYLRNAMRNLRHSGGARAGGGRPGGGERHAAAGGGGGGGNA